MWKWTGSRVQLPKYSFAPHGPFDQHINYQDWCLFKINTGPRGTFFLLLVYSKYVVQILVLMITTRSINEIRYLGLKVFSLYSGAHVYVYCSLTCVYLQFMSLQFSTSSLITVMWTNFMGPCPALGRSNYLKASSREGYRSNSPSVWNRW
ncbi:hypothetical protein F5050DRAFT_788591 [Lentinula boryana]|uniref:Uncharacterized protein n=1 Tax=Lentinula boryana TaxID=40481 RepID=A0ABQ8Q3F4_9AGAR|nr:hypothetical protein F5050DRAFT_788591 [Lentinula boryana]